MIKNHAIAVLQELKVLVNTFYSCWPNFELNASHLQFLHSG